MITYCGSCASIPARSSAARIAIEPSSVAGCAASPPPSLPNGVRTALTMTLAWPCVDASAGSSSRGVSRRANATTSADHGLEVVERRRARPASACSAAAPRRARSGRRRARRAPRRRRSASASRRDLERVRDLLLLGRARAGRRRRVLRIGPRAIAAPAPSSTLPAALRVAAGHVGRVGDVDRERDVGLERERRRARAVVADLLLNRRDRDDVDLRVAGLADPPRRLERDVGAEPVVERASRRSARSAARPARRPRRPRRPTRTSRAASSRSFAPISMWRSECSTFTRSPRFSGA